VREAQAIAAGRRAADILSDEVFVAMISLLRNAAVDRWASATTVDARETEHKRLEAVAYLVSELKALAAQGRRIEAEIARRRDDGEAQR